MLVWQSAVSVINSLNRKTESLTQLLYAVRNTARHHYDIPVSFIDESYVKRAFTTNLITGPTKWFAKAAILALYLRLFGLKLWLRYTSYVMLLITFLFYWASIPMSAALCVPHHAESWNYEVLQRCGKMAVTGPIFGAVGVASDVLLLILPLPIVYGLNMPPRKKLGLYMVFLVGCLYVYYILVEMTNTDVTQSSRCKFGGLFLLRPNIQKQ